MDPGLSARALVVEDPRDEWYTRSPLLPSTMPSASLYTTGIPAYLLDHDDLGTRGWTHRNKTLTRRGDRTTFTLTFRAVPHRRLEPWQRTGFWMAVDAAVAVPEVASILGERASTPLVTGSLCPPAGSDPWYAWQTHDETVEPLAEAIGRRVRPIIDAVATAIDHPAGFEAIAWQSIEDEYEVNWPTPPRLWARALTWSVAIADSEEQVAYYAAALLQRKDHEAAARLLAASRIKTGIRPQLWEALREELARQRKARAPHVPLPSVDWDFDALDKAVTQAEQSASRPATLEVSTPAATPAAVGSIWETLRSAIRPVNYRFEPDNTFYRPAKEEWRALRTTLGRLTKEEAAQLPAHAAMLDAALDSMPDAFREVPEAWVEQAAKGHAPVGWSLARSLILDPKRRLDPTLTATLRRLQVWEVEDIQHIRAESLPEVTAVELSLSELNARGFERLVQVLPKFDSITAECSPELLTTLAGMPAASQLRRLDSTRSQPYDKGLRALAKSKHLGSLRELHLSSTVKAPAIKALLKSPWAPGLQSLAFHGSSPGGIRTLLSGMSGPLAGLQQLSIDYSAEFGATALPSGLSRLCFAPGDADLDAFVSANAGLPLRQLTVGGFSLSVDTARSLTTWPALAGVEELKLKVGNDDGDGEAIFGHLASRRWDALRTISLMLYDADDGMCARLAQWLAQCPALEALHIRTSDCTVTTSGAQVLAEAAVGVRTLDVEIPAMLEALVCQSWPALVALRLNLQAETSERTYPIRPQVLQVLGTHMPALRMAMLNEGELEDEAMPVVEELRALPHLLTLMIGPNINLHDD